MLADGTTLRTDNNGDTFAQKVAVPGTRAAGGGAAVNDIRFTDANTGVAATNNGKVYRTTDGANSWVEVESYTRAVRKFLFLDANNGVAVGDQSLFARDDHRRPHLEREGPGASRLRRTSPTSPAPTASTCVMATATTQLVRTADGGVTGTLVTPAQTPINAAAFASPTRVTALGVAGTTAISDDAGAKTFAPVGGSLPGTLRRDDRGPRGQSRSRRVRRARSPRRSTAAHRGRAATCRPRTTSSTSRSRRRATGYALDDGGGLFRTGDGGATWRALDIGTTARPSAVEAPSADDRHHRRPEGPAPLHGLR